MAHTINVRLEDELYEQFKDFCSQIHIPAATLMASYAAQAVRDGTVSFSVRSSANSAFIRAQAQQATESTWAQSAERFPLGLNEDELMADIDEAVAAVRAHNKAHR